MFDQYFLQLIAYSTQSFPKSSIPLRVYSEISLISLLASSSLLAITYISLYLITFPLSETISIVNDSIISGKSSTAKTSSSSSVTSKPLLVDAKLLTGIGGLQRTMNFIDTKSPPVKGNFSYKDESNRKLKEDRDKRRDEINARAREAYKLKQNKLKENFLNILDYEHD